MGRRSRGPGRHGNKLGCWTRRDPQPLPAPPLGYPAVGALVRPLTAQHPAAGLHTGTWKPSPGRREAKGREGERPDQWARPSFHHLSTHSSPIQASRLLQLTPSVLRPTIAVWETAVAVSGRCWVSICCLLFFSLCPGVPLCIYPSVLSPGYQSCVLCPCLSSINASVSDPASVLPADPVSVV